MSSEFRFVAFSQVLHGYIVSLTCRYKGFSTSALLTLNFCTPCKMASMSLLPHLTRTSPTRTLLCRRLQCGLSLYCFKGTCSLLSGTYGLMAISWLLIDRNQLIYSYSCGKYWSKRYMAWEMWPIYEKESSPTKDIGELRSRAGAGIRQTEQKGRVSVLHWHRCQEWEGTDRDSRWL